ncbi:Bromodomain-containing protein [Hypoxylon sp. NC1633]|nr:Bromodomain-containing protein [Hypoxylon sp. NC1633]
MLTDLKPAVLEEQNGKIQVLVVNNDGTIRSTIVLTGLKTLFQAKLPGMPREYVTRIVFDRTHLSLAIVKPPSEVVAGVAWREFRDRKFAEIVFVGVSDGHQGAGYGAHLMNHLKDYVKATSPVMYFLTYADNNAIGYFKKQGFTMEITLGRDIWAGCIKHYTGAKLMQCSMLPRIRYLQAGRMLQMQKEAVLAKIRAETQSHIVHQPPAQWANGVMPIDPLSIPAIRASGWTPAKEELARAQKRGPHFDKLRQLLDQIKSHNKAGPFLKPVDKAEAPSYYKIIKSPMDLSTMEVKLQDNQYQDPKDLFDDLWLMFWNCHKYNNKGTKTVQYGTVLEKRMWTLIKKVPEWAKAVEALVARGSPKESAEKGRWGRVLRRR